MKKYIYINYMRHFPWTPWTLDKKMYTKQSAK